MATAEIWLTRNINLARIRIRTVQKERRGDESLEPGFDVVVPAIVRTLASLFRVFALSRFWMYRGV